MDLGYWMVYSILVEKNMKTIKELEASIEERRTRRPLTKEECGLKGYKQALKDVLGLIDEKLKELRKNKAKCCDKWYCETCNVLLTLIYNFEELKAKIEG